MPLYGRYFSQRDINLINQFNAELMRDIIETLVVLFKIAPNETNTNIYGETVAAEGKSFYPGVELSSLIDRGDISTDDEGFGPDRDQTVVFKLRENTCNDASYFPEVGDLILFNNEAMPIELMTDLIFEDIGGHEIINIARTDTINGQTVIYQPIKNLTSIQQNYKNGMLVLDKRFLSTAQYISSSARKK